jgi:hypothetical protein
MSEYRKQVAFLKSLMTYDDNAEHRLLCERLTGLERNERCLLCACRLVGLIALLAMAGIGYSAVLLPEFFDNATHLILRFFTALGLGSLICFTAFLGVWFWYRLAMNRIHDECRRSVTRMVDSRFKTSTTTFYPVIMNDSKVGVADGPVDESLPGTGLTGLPKAS